MIPSRSKGAPLGLKSCASVMNVEQTNSDTTPRAFGFGRAEWLFSALCVLFIAFFAFLVILDNVDESAVSNRSFASPALGLACTISTYAVWRFRSLPPFVRIFGWLGVTFVLYLGFGLAFILLNAFLGELL